MNRDHWIVIVFFAFVFTSLQSWSDSYPWNVSKRGVEPVNNELYQEECGACHFAYQPGLLPERSWVKIMSNKSLLDHFGEDVSFEDKGVLNELVSYLKNNASDKSSYSRSRKILRSIGSNETPMRVSETTYIVRKHREISDHLIEQEVVGSLANCSACHNGAERGDFDDDSVTIPDVKAGLIRNELDSQPDGFKGVIKSTGEDYKIVTTRVQNKGSYEKLCRVVEFENGKRTFFCKVKGGNWY